MKRKSTMVELVDELEKVTPRTPFLEVTIAEAKAGEYHDYKNQKYVCGKVALVERLNYLHQHELTKRVIDGEFDEVADETDKEELRKGLPPAMWPVMGLDK